jgi:transcriptional regulator with XRE-family HTH domain
MVKRGLSRVAFAAKLRITQSYLSHIYAGRRTPGQHVQYRIEDEAGIPARAWVTVKARERRTRAAARRLDKVEKSRDNLPGRQSAQPSAWR